MGLQGLCRLERARHTGSLVLPVFGTLESLKMEKEQTSREQIPGRFLILWGALIILQVFVGQLMGAGKWGHDSNTCYFGFLTLIMENFKSRQNSLINL